MNSTTFAIGRPGLLTRRSVFDWVFALLVLAGTAFAFARYGASMDVYETWILAGAAPAVISLGWFWGRLRVLALAVGAAALLAVSLYARATDGFGADLAQADNVFLLKYLLSSQSAILWMSLLFFMSTAFYWIGLVAGGADNTAQRSRSASRRRRAPACGSAARSRGRTPS